MMRSFLLDTNAISDLVKANPRIDARFAAVVPPDRVVTCAIVRGEILHGLLNMPDGARRRALEAQVTLLLQRIPCEAVPPSAADHYAVLKQVRRAKGTPLDENDLWIAATAIAMGAVLVTRDHDFAGSPGLSVENWSA